VIPAVGGLPGILAVRGGKPDILLRPPADRVEMETLI
jgi:hypothetical protein